MLVNCHDCKRPAANEPPVCEDTQPTLDDTSAFEAESSDESDSGLPAKVERAAKIHGGSSSGFAGTIAKQQSYSTSPDKLRGPTYDSFFSTVSSAGFPASRPKNQPWKKHWSLPKQSICTPGTDEMVVLCPARWDYGEEPEFQGLSLALIHRRFELSWGLLKIENSVDIGHQRTCHGSQIRTGRYDG
jgi:hypothetical protein